MRRRGSPRDPKSLPALVEGLAAAEAALAAGVGGQVDAVLDPASGTPVLLRRAQEALRESAARYQHLLAQVGALVVELTPAGATLFVSDAVTRITGYRPAELMERNWWDVLAAADEREAVAELRARLAEGDVTGHELVLRARDGRPVVLAFSSANRYGSRGALERVTLFALDVTRQRRAEEVARALADVGRELITTFDVTQLADRVAGTVVRLFAGRHALLHLADPSGQMLVPAASAGDDRGRPLADRPLAPGEGLAGLAFRERRAIASSDVTSDPRIVLPDWLRQAVAGSGFVAEVAVPLIVRDRALGVLRLGDVAGRVFTDDDVRLLAAFADQAALAIDNARLHEETRRRLVETETLLALGQVIASPLDLPETMRRVARETCRALGADMVGTYLPDDGGDLLHPVAGYRVPESLRGTFLRVPVPIRGHRFVEEACATGEPAWSSHVTADARIDQGTVTHFPHRALFFIPVLAGGRCVAGLFAVWWHHAWSPAPETLRLARGIAGQAGIAVEKLRLFREAERRHREREVVADLSQLVLTGPAVETVLEQAVATLAETLDVEHAKVLELLPDGEALVLRAGVGWREGAVGRATVDAGANSQAGYTLLTGELVVVEDLRRETRFSIPPLLSEHGIVSGMSVVIEGRERPYGILGVHTTRRRQFQAHEAGVLQAVANVLAAAIEHDRAQAALRRSEEAYRTLVENSIQGIYIHEDWRIRIANRAAAAFLGFDRAEDLVGRDVRDFCAPEERERVQRYRDARLRGEPAPARFEYQILRRDGSRAWVDNSATRIVWEGRPAVLATFVDITEQKRAAEVRDALARVGRELVQTLDLRQASNRIVATVLSLFRPFHVALFELDAASGELVCIGVAGEREASGWLGRRLPRGMGVSWRALETGRPVWVADQLREPGLTLPGWLRDAVEARGVNAVLAIPLVTGRGALGTLVLADAADRTYGEEELALLGAFADQAAIAIQNARTFAESEARRQAAEAVADVARLLAESLDPIVVARRIADTVRGLFRAVSGTVYRLEEATGELVALAASGAIAPGNVNLRLARGTGLAGLVTRERRALASPNVVGDPRITFTDGVRAGLEQTPIRAALAAPMIVQDRVIGAVSVADREGREFTAEDLSLLQLFADQAAIAVRTSQLFTAEREARAATEASEARLRVLFDESPVAMWVFDADTLELLELNRQAVALYGYARDELIGRSLAELLIPEDVPRLLGRPDELRRGAWPAGEWRHRRRDSTLIDVEMYPRPIRFAGRAAVLTVVQDVTRRIELEERLRQAQKMEAVGRLAGGIAHDFNNILTVIGGRATALLEQLPPDSREYEIASLILRAGERAALLTRQLLAFSRRQVLQPRVLDLNALVSGLEPMLRRLIGEDVEVTSKLDPALGAVRADPGQLEQVIMNLAVNARDAMPHGGRLGIETRNVDLPPGYSEGLAGRCVLLVVSDTGIGMDADTRAHVFEPFFTTKEPGKGTGLGLSTVYGIVRQSGGHIELESEPGQGATFRIYLPHAGEVVASASETPDVSPTATGTETILLVEDEPEVRELAREVLEGAGFRVLGAGGPLEAVAVAERHPGPIHLMLTDVIMPGGNGRQLADRIQASRPLTRVLFMSGYTDDAIVQHDVLDPHTAFIEKPFSLDGLLRKVREVLDAPPPADPGAERAKTT